VKQALHILKPELMTTVQDLGRAGFQNLGIGISGALDPIALRLANLLVVAVPKHQAEPADATDGNDPHPCPHCGGRMIIIETFERGSMPRHRPKGPTVAIGIDTS